MSGNDKVPPSERLKGFISFENGIDDDMRRKIFPGAATYLPIIANIALGQHRLPAPWGQGDVQKHPEEGNNP